MESSPSAQSPTHRNTADTPAVLAVFSRKLARMPVLPTLLGTSKIVVYPVHRGQVTHVACWGKKKSAKRAERYAKRHGLPLIRLEDGFLRSVKLGVEQAPPLSLVVDHIGIYYDASAPSDLERILRDDPRLDDPALLRRARWCIDQIVANKLSKYNYSPTTPASLPPTRYPRRVLVVDQTAGDMSLALGRMPRSRFADMLQAALDENPDAQILIRTHPDVAAGKRRGNFAHIPKSDRVALLTEPANPIDLLQQVDKVYVGTSLLGFEALLVGREVVCFGAPFYAGWGLTDDRQEQERRSVPRTVEQVFAAAYILYARYIDPFTREPGEIEDVIRFLALQRRMFAKNRGTFFCFGFSVWKRNFVRQYLQGPDSRVVFVRDADDAVHKGFDKDSSLLVWGRRETDGIAALARQHDVPIWRMEDGFLRSSGLGSDLTPPRSLVVDTRGIYYDPNHPSDLETILETATFSKEELEDAARLREFLLASQISKYNLDGGERLALTSGDREQRVILVPGQVEDDASIRLGCVDIRTNLGLLEEVRKNNPDAFIIFKPHPDVVSGNRKGAVPADRAAQLADAVLEDSSIAHCLELADEVHTMTSLVGFEGLLRDLTVHVYGRPFYSGWGLTIDRHRTERRTAKRTVLELIAAALIRYPRYLDPDTGAFSTAMDTAHALKRERDQHGPQKVKMSWSGRQLRKLQRVLSELTHAP